jgi:alpha-tubulin suppressor-like RCC1 family protein
MAVQKNSLRLTLAAICFQMATVAVATSPLTNVTAISAGHDHACALTTGGAVTCWGHNNYGQLGDSTTTDRPAAAIVPGLASGVIGVTLGSGHTCALTSAGGVKCWGRNSEGQLGDGTRVDRSTPVDVSGLASGTLAVVAGGLHTCAIVTGGLVKCWGTNEQRQLGIDNTFNKGSMVPLEVSSDALALALGATHTCALRSGGGVRCWGANDRGQVGDGTTALQRAQFDIPGLSSGVASVGTGSQHSCAVMAAGGAKCWGFNFYGQLANGQTADALVPADVVGLPSSTAITGGFAHTCAIATGGSAKCWGFNSQGQLGNGTTSGVLQPGVPADVSGLPGTVSSIDAGENFTCAVAAGQAWCWGSNLGGEMGNPSAGASQPTPAVVQSILLQSINLSVPATSDRANSPVTVSATATSGLPVTFASSTPSVCTVTGASVTLVEAGLCTIQANQAGSSDYWKAPEVASTFLVRDAAAPSPPRLANLATRGRVLGGSNDVLIAGFAVKGPGSKTVVIRARGPSLSATGVSDPLANPTIRVFSPNSNNPLAANDDWGSGEHAAIIQAIGLAPADPLESAILISLGPGLYSAVVDDAQTDTGVAIVEVFEVDHPDSPLVNIATRGQVLTGEDVMIAGFIIQGNGPQQVVVRARGPSMNIQGRLANPMLQLYEGQTPLSANDDWGTASNASALQASGFAPPDPQEAAILVTLNPGAYTAIVSGVGGTTGIGLVEVFAVP